MLRLRIVSALTVIAIMLGGTVCVNAAETKSAVVSYGKAVIDGVKDEAYNSFTPLVTDVEARVNDVAKDAKATIYLTWNYDGLCVFAEVYDSTPDNSNVDARYEQDSVEIFLDEDVSKSDRRDNNDAQYRITKENMHDVGLCAEDNFKSAAKTTTSGYNIEALLPWRDLFPRDGMVMGFDFLVNDAIGGKRVAMRNWNSHTNKNYVTTEDYGEIKLVYGSNFKGWNGTDPLKICIDDRIVDCGDAPPVVINGRTLVPMRAAFERLGARVAWNDAENSVYAIHDGKLIIMKINSNIATVNGIDEVLEVPAMLINDRTMVPIRFVGETLNATVDYDDYIGAVVIEYANKKTE